MRRLLILLVLTTSGVVAGCAGGSLGYTATAAYSSPSLAYVSPGVYVVADYHEPVFYSNNLYWRYDNGYWYRSRYFDRGWNYAPRPPRTVLSIQRPHAYIRYRPSQRYRATRNYDYNRGRGGVRVRDHRRRY